MTQDDITKVQPGQQHDLGISEGPNQFGKNLVNAATCKNEGPKVIHGFSASGTRKSVNPS